MQIFCKVTNFAMFTFPKETLCSLTKNLFAHKTVLFLLESSHTNSDVLQARAVFHGRIQIIQVKFFLGNKHLTQSFCRERKYFAK